MVGLWAGNVDFLRKINELWSFFDAHVLEKTIQLFFLPTAENSARLIKQPEAVHGVDGLVLSVGGMDLKTSLSSIKYTSAAPKARQGGTTSFAVPPCWSVKWFQGHFGNTSFGQSLPHHIYDFRKLLDQRRKSSAKVGVPCLETTRQTHCFH